MSALLRFGFEPRSFEALNGEEQQWLKTLSPRLSAALCINGLYCKTDVLKAIENGSILQAINIGKTTRIELYQTLGIATALRR